MTELLSFGLKSGIEIFRLQTEDSYSGIVFQSGNLLITAGHVTQENTLEGFREITEYDIAYKPTQSNSGLPLGSIVSPCIECTVVTSSLDDVTNLVEVPGRLSLLNVLIGVSGHMRFFPNKRKDMRLFVPGASGSPVIYKKHVIGLISQVGNMRTITNEKYDFITAVIFSPSNRRQMEDFLGQPIPEVR